MAFKEPSIHPKEFASTNELQDDSTDSGKSNDKRHSTHSHSSSDPDETKATDNNLPPLHTIYNDAQSLAEVKSISRIESRAMTRHATNRTGVSVATSLDQNFEIDFEDGDPADPHNWPFWYRCAVLFFVSFATLTVVMSSTGYTSGIPGIVLTFHLEEKTLAILGITTYMLGLALGSVILAPLSEMYGRRPIYIVAIVLFGVLTIPCALAPNLETILVFRFLATIAGSAMVSNAPGTVNDVVLEEHRALAFSIWSIGPLNGPVIGPLVGGFVYQYLGWRWTNWIVLVSAGVSSVFLFLVKETYAPAILRKMAAKKRKETGDGRWWCRYDVKKGLWPLLKLNLSRPFIMAVTEPICIFWNIYVALVYAVLYLCFVAYPIVFAEGRGWSPGISGLGFCGIGLGSLMVIALEPAIRKMINSHKIDPETGMVPPEAMVSTMCIAAICVPVGELIFAWTCTPDMPWIVPILAGVPFGAGNTAVFIYSSNYLVHSYGIYAASALAGNAVLRSVLGGVLPLAGPPLYAALGPHWAGTLLALLEFAMVPIPFVFYRYGHRIRMKSKLIRAMQEDKDRLEAKNKKADSKRASDVLRAANEMGGAEKLPAPVIGADSKHVEMEDERKSSGQVDGKANGGKAAIDDEEMVDDFALDDVDGVWSSDDDELLADDFSPTTRSSKTVPRAKGSTSREEGRPKLHDARLDEPRTTEFTMTKFDRHSRKMDTLRAFWVKEARKHPRTQLLAPPPPPPIAKNAKKSKANASKKLALGTPIHDSYAAYHNETVALLKPEAEALEKLYRDFELKRSVLGMSLELYLVKERKKETNDSEAERTFHRRDNHTRSSTRANTNKFLSSKGAFIGTLIRQSERETSNGSVPKCTSAYGNDDLAMFTLPSSCGLCQRNEVTEKKFDEYKETIRRMAVSRNEETGQLFMYLGNTEPIMTEFYDTSIDESGTIMARLYINGLEVQSERLKLHELEGSGERIALILDAWIDAKKRWMTARRDANPDWQPPDTLDDKDGIKTAYSNWFKKCAEIKKIFDEANEMCLRVGADMKRANSYRETRWKMGDKPNSRRKALPYVKRLPGDPVGFPRRPSPLRHELKVEDLEEHSGDEGGWFDWFDFENVAVFSDFDDVE
ncbi:hypothetical protein FKW77_002285 [Venturia effusa]|uniref:Major facilitator superfamily (MFS) profile domain-containing protein n=1 Tax=Venturia effusa TaxID=50376 RepID=A0A517L8S4_9PEZI|nr:hypothetical protein FKW77_002285 [Venturia effusa]